MSFAMPPRIVIDNAVVNAVNVPKETYTLITPVDNPLLPAEK